MRDSAEGGFCRERNFFVTFGRIDGLLKDGAEALEPVVDQALLLRPQAGIVASESLSRRRLLRSAELGATHEECGERVQDWPVSHVAVSMT